MRLLIHDANVLIDLIDTGLLDLALSLPFVMETTDLVRVEVEPPEQVQVLEKCIDNGSLGLIYSSVMQLANIYSLKSENPRLSIADCSVIFHALDRSGIVLSGDGRLRKEAEAKKLEVHGTLWVLALMVDQGHLDPATAIAKLKFLMNTNQRLPQKDCARLIESWTDR